MNGCYVKCCLINYRLTPSLNYVENFEYMIKISVKQPIGLSKRYTVYKLDSRTRSLNIILSDSD